MKKPPPLLTPRIISNLRAREVTVSLIYAPHQAQPPNVGRFRPPGSKVASGLSKGFTSFTPWPVRFGTFKPAGRATPSLAALALQAYALDAYPQLVRVTKTLAPQTVGCLAAPGPLADSRGQLQAHMLAMRYLLLGDPAPMDALRRVTFGAAREGNRATAALTSLYLALR